MLRNETVAALWLLTNGQHTATSLLDEPVLRQRLFTALLDTMSELGMEDLLEDHLAGGAA